MQRIYIDANAAIGRTSFRETEIPYKTETLLSDMEYCRIHAALVSSLVARDYSFVLGNTEILADTKANNRLLSVAVVIPGLKFELVEGDKYLDMLVDNGVKAFKMLPQFCEHEFSPFSVETTAEFLIPRKMPLLVNLGQVSLDNLRQVLRAFPKLNVLLCGTYWSDNRNLFPLMEKFPNLHFEISSNQSNDILAISKQHLGIDRVLFGTDYPNKSPGALKAMVEYSDLCEEDKNLVAAGNAARLFNIDLASLTQYDEDKCQLDSIARVMDSGKPLSNELVIDPHTHMVDREHQAVSITPMYNSDEDCIIKKMDLLGIDRIITSPWEGIMTSKGGNETTLKAHQKYGSRIEGYVTYNPNYPEDLDKAIEVFHEKQRFIGIKPYHPRHQISLLDERYDRWFEYGNQHNLIMLVHVETPEIPLRIDELAQKYPNMSFLLAHTGQSYDIARCNIAVAKERPNVYLEITYTALTYGIIEYMVREVGAEKVIYGSDIPMRDAAAQLAWVCYARITEEEKRKIIGGNIQKLMDRCYQA
jgi:predicted TIM-barrel fold metal-dependent hydrolase